MNKLNLLDPKVRKYFDNFVNKLEQKNYQYFIIETLRTIETQTAYYAQGRKSFDEINELRRIASLPIIGVEESQRIITQTMQSVHLSGRAADIVPVVNGKIPWNITGENAELWKAFGALGKEAGLEWGGAWIPLNAFGIGWDAAHYQFAAQ